MACQLVKASVTACSITGARPTVSRAVVVIGQPSCQSEPRSSRASRVVQVVTASVRFSAEPRPARRMTANSWSPCRIASAANSCFPPGKKW